MKGQLKVPNQEKYSIKEGIHRTILSIIYKYQFIQEIDEEDDEIICGLMKIFVNTLSLISEEDFDKMMQDINKRNIIDMKTFELTNNLIKEIIKKVSNEEI